MGRQKIKPEIREEDLGVNPFVVDLVIDVNKFKKKVKNEFGQDVFDSIEFEATPYCKLFEAKESKKDMLRLGIRSKEMLLYFLYSVNSAKDYLWVGKREYMISHGIKSVNTFKVALNELIHQGYICKINGFTDVYWINPMYFFKGNRLTKYPNNIRTKYPAVETAVS